MPGPFVRRVALRNYKSIARCDVELQPLTVLVGRNGSGKSNFVDALALVADALRTSLEQAVQDRGGVRSIARAGSGNEGASIELQLDLGPDATAEYGIRLRLEDEHGWSVAEERCVVSHGADRHDYVVRSGSVESTTEPVLPAASSTRLLLSAASGLPPFRPLFDLLTRMGSYNLNPVRMREALEPRSEELLAHDGRNLANVFRTIEHRSPATKQLILEYLVHFVPGLTNVRSLEGAYTTLEFDQTVRASTSTPATFLARNMSDGTLRATAILTALLQGGGGLARIPLVAIEEPETALHPAAVGVLLHVLRDASRTTQVLVTTHSVELLDHDELPLDAILNVTLRDGVTTIAPLDDISRDVVRDGLTTPGELLRQDHLAPSAPAQAS